MENSPRNERPTLNSKSPLELARTALAAAREAIPEYSSRFSRHDYTQHQLYALVALRRRLKTDYRGLEATLRDWTELRDALGLSHVPDHSTIQRAERRFDTKSKSKRKPAQVEAEPEAMPLFDQPALSPTPALAACPVSGNAA
jgi:hypothetical protein